MTRREILRTLAATGLLPLFDRSARASEPEHSHSGVLTTTKIRPVILSTWNFGMAANKPGWEILQNNGRALDAVEAAARVPEADPENQSVGLGGLPDRDGIVTLDACIMDELGNAGSVMALEQVVHAISVARRVMEKTPHVILAGKGALDFAMAEGFDREVLLTDASHRAWLKWKEEHHYPSTSTPPAVPVPDATKNRQHDTIGVLALDMAGNLSGACTTSGLAWKYHGRVGDSPVIGAGLFVDNEVGAAAATGKGEAVVKIAGSHTVVEMMRRGASPQEACEEAVNRIVRKQSDYHDFQVAFIALNKAGETGAFAIAKGFQFARTTPAGAELIDGASYLK